MPSIKCPACGQRILNSAGIATCPNCGEALVPQLIAPINPATPDEDISSSIDLNKTPHYAEDKNDNAIPLSHISQTRATSQFPKGFPRRSPDLEGIVTLLESHEEPKRSNSAVDATFNTLLGFIWSIPGGSSSSQLNKEKEKIQVMRIRIRTDADEQRDVRIEGRLTGVNIAQGDQISLWGKNHKGLLAFQYGYNHTIKGPIRTSTMTSPFSGFLFIFVGIAGILILLYYHIIPRLP